MNNANTSGFTQGWPEPAQFRRSIRTEFSLLVAGMMVALMMIFGYVVTERYVTTVSYHVTKSLVTQARSSSLTASNHLISGSGSDRLMMNNICRELMADNPDLHWVGITDAAGIFVAHTDIQQVMAEASLPDLTSDQHDDLLHPGEKLATTSDTMYITIPIEEGEVGLGSLAMASSMDAMQAARNANIKTVVYITALFLVIGVPITIIRLRRKLRPISDIAHQLKELDLDTLTARITHQGDNEIGYLAETLRVMGSKLHQAQKEHLEKERLAQEMQIARDIQASILPHDYPAAGPFRFAGSYRSAREVGGDYYDFIRFDEHQLAFIIADVSGKSLPAMLVMLLTRDIVKRHSHTVREPVELLSLVNRELHSSIRPGMFVTMLFGVLDTRTGLCRFASAGHNSVIRVDGSTQQTHTVKTKGFPLGLVDADTFDKRIESGEIQFKDSDWLVLYTDGINEAKNEAGEQFGIERLVNLVTAYQAVGPEEMVTISMQELEQFVGEARQYDDLTLLVMKWQADTPGATVSPQLEGARVRT
jgi:serine phosphatase RsbU (regulator of sigma subunit)